MEEFEGMHAKRKLFYGQLSGPYASCFPFAPPLHDRLLQLSAQSPSVTCFVKVITES